MFLVMLLVVKNSLVLGVQQMEMFNYVIIIITLFLRFY